MIRTALCPSSWNRRSLRNGTVWPRWTSIPVGSMPYLTRRGWPVLRLRSSFWRSSAFCWASVFGSMRMPRQIRASCSSTGFTGRPLAKHLKPPHRFKGVTVMDHGRFAPPRGPGDGEYVEAGGPAEQVVLAQDVQGQVRQPALLGRVYRQGGPFEVLVARGADLDED